MFHCLELIKYLREYRSLFQLLELWHLDLQTLVQTITQFADQVKTRLISQLVNAFQEFSKNCLSILIVLLLQLFVFALKQNKSLALAPLNSKISPIFFTAAIPLQYWHNLRGVFLNNYRYILLYYISTLPYQYLQHYLPVCYLFWLYN